MSSDLRLGPVVFGLVSPEQSLADDPEAQRLAAAAAALALIPNPDDAVRYPAGLEHRVVSRARDLRARRLPARIRPGVARRIAFAALLIAALAAAGVFAWLAFEPNDPIGGRAVALSEDGGVGVLLPRYEERPFALVFWGLPDPEDGETWQLWLVRRSGDVAPGPAFVPDEEGRAAIVINPNTLETGDPPIGFAISLDDPAERAAETPARQDIRYQFSLE